MTVLIVKMSLGVVNGAAVTGETMPATRTSPRMRINRHALQAIRVKQQLTQEQLAAQAGIDNTTVCRLERGQRPTLPADALQRVAEVLEVPVSALCAAGPL